MNDLAKVAYEAYRKGMIKLYTLGDTTLGDLIDSLDDWENLDRDTRQVWDNVAQEVMMGGE